MIHLRKVKYIEPVKSYQDRFPFNIPIIKFLKEIEFTSQVTFLVGENGTGKSTFIEALAAAVGSITVGGEGVQWDKSLAHARLLANQFKLTWQKRTHRGFFLRAEDFFNFTRKLSAMRSEMMERLKEIEEEYQGRPIYSRELAQSPYRRSLYEMEERYGENLDANSHGESFLKLFESRFVPNGLYLLDEPEAALSPMRQLGLLVMLKEMVAQNSQFIIATHSPILMAFPDAAIFSFDQTPIGKVEYEDLEHVKLTRDFLNNPDLFIRRL